MPGDPGATVVTCLRAFYFCTQGCGCNGHPAFPTPSVGRKVHAQLGRIALRECGCVSESGWLFENGGWYACEAIPRLAPRIALVMPGLDPGIHQSSQQGFSKTMDHRVKPGDDDLN
jgi:hypothetical protein